MTPRSAQGATITINGTKISGMTAINPQGETRAETETTTIADDVKTWRTRGGESGTYELALKYDPADAGQAALRTAMATDTPATFVVTMPGIGTTTFTGAVKAFPRPALSAGSLMQTTASIRVAA